MKAPVPLKQNSATQTLPAQARLDPPVPPYRPGQTALDLKDLPGWRLDDHLAALAAFQHGCGVAVDGALRAVCQRARAQPFADDRAARAFFEANFRAVRVGAEGLLTAYFAPEYEARATRDAVFTAPVRPRPDDLITLDLGLFDPALAGHKLSGHRVGQTFAPYPDRAEIEQSAPRAVAAWMRPEDLFFMQIQGAGVLGFPDGRRLKATFAGSNGRPFVGIAAILRDRGLLPDSDTSGEAIRRWLRAHEGADADAVMRADPRYVFFDLSPDNGLDPQGAAGVSLVARRSLAIDPLIHRFGGVYWIDARAPVLAGAVAAYQRLVIALDTGGAIKGDVRADLYMGRGYVAGVEAGKVRHRLRLYRLEPINDPLSAP